VTNPTDLPARTNQTSDPQIAQALETAWHHLIAAQGDHEWSDDACTADDRVFCWGRNDRGQLGDDSGIDEDLPVEIHLGEALR
jgi:alpha-tubulin suppressor-like RCC1 family protein